MGKALLHGLQTSVVAVLALVDDVDVARIGVLEHEEGVSHGIAAFSVAFSPAKAVWNAMNCA